MPENSAWELIKRTESIVVKQKWCNSETNLDISEKLPHRGLMEICFKA